MGLLDRIAPRRTESEPSAPMIAALSTIPIFSTKALRKFLTALTSRECPSLLDLGPVVGSNVSFFGEQLGCKIFVEDIFADLDRHVREDKLEALPDFLSEAIPAGRRSGRRHSLLGSHGLSRSRVRAGPRDPVDARVAPGRRAARVFRDHSAARRRATRSTSLPTKSICGTVSTAPRAGARPSSPTATSSGCSAACGCRTRSFCKTTSGKFSFESRRSHRGASGASRSSPTSVWRITMSGR